MAAINSASVELVATVGSFIGHCCTSIHNEIATD